MIPTAEALLETGVSTENAEAQTTRAQKDKLLGVFWVELELPIVDMILVGFAARSNEDQRAHDQV